MRLSHQGIRSSITFVKIASLAQRVPIDYTFHSLQWSLNSALCSFRMKLDAHAWQRG